MIKKITQKEIKELINITKNYKNFDAIYFFIDNGTLYKEINLIGQSLSNTYNNRDYIPCVDLNESFIFNKEYTMRDNIRDIQLNVNEMVGKYNEEFK